MLPQSHSYGNHGGHPSRMKRASLACTACHDRKIKCDLQHRKNSSCTNCQASGALCRPRSSKRARQRQLQAVTIGEQRNSSQTSPNIPNNSNNNSQITSQRGCNNDNMTSAGLLTSTTPPLQHTQTNSRLRDNNRHCQAPSYVGEAGFMSLFREDCRLEGHEPHSLDDTSAFDMPPDWLLDGFFETYNEFCFTWCPIIETHDLELSSPLLRNALGLAASQIKPSAIQYALPEDYYIRAKKYFYNGQEANPMIAIKAIMLFYWWSPVSPLVCSQDSIWWWTGAAIRMAQEIGLHREPNGNIPTQELGLHRRMWWTLFARERLTALSQGRPCLINPDDCDVEEPVLADFPDPQDMRAEIFVHWIRLCRIMGRMNECITRPRQSTQFPPYLFAELGDWIDELPKHLMLEITTNRTTKFNRDVHLSFLPYLTAVALLHFTRSVNAAPRASTAAVLAASCSARIFQDLLVRGSIRYLPAISGWYISIALLALLSARHIEDLTTMVDDHIRILRIAMKELSAVYVGTEPAMSCFERLLRVSYSSSETNSLATSSSEPAWLRFFPFATPQTSELVSTLLNNAQLQPSMDMFSTSDYMLQFDELLDMVTFPNNFTPSLK